MLGLLNKLIGDSNEQAIKKIRPVVEKINDLESSFTSLSDFEPERQDA